MRSGLTLLEVLAVTLLIALIAGVTLGGWRPRTAADSPMAALRRLDQSLRLQAREHGGTTLLIREDGLVAQPLDGRPAPPLPSTMLTFSWRTAAGDARDGIRYDHRGYTLDAEVTITGHEHGGSTAFALHGITGIIAEIRDRP